MSDNVLTKKITLNSKSKIVISISLITLVSVIIGIIAWSFNTGGKYKAAEVEIKKVPQLEERITNIEYDIKDLNTTQQLQGKDIGYMKEKVDDIGKDVKTLLRVRRINDN